MSFITDLIDGIKYMIETFKRIICFLASVPVRIRNLNAGFSNIFKGINAEFVAIGKSFNMGVSSISVLTLYIGELISTNVGCGFKFFANFFDCILYYIVDAVLYIIYLPIKIIIWGFKLFSIDFTYIEERVYNGLKTLNDFLYPITGFHIIHWPKPIREKICLIACLKTIECEKPQYF